MKDGLSHGLRNGHGHFRKCTGLEGLVELGGSSAREPVQLLLLSLTELLSERGMGVGDALFVFVDERLAQSK